MTSASSESIAGTEPAGETKAKPKAKKAYVVLALVVVAAAAIYLVVQMLTRGRENTDDAQVEADVVPIAARVGGAVLKVHAQDNQLVKKGELLLEIDPRDLTVKVSERQAELEAAKAQEAAAEAQMRVAEATTKGGLTAARAQLSGTATSVGSADAQIASARATVARAEAEATRAENDLARAESLRKDEAIPVAQLDTARANAAAARAAVAQARAQLSMSEEARRTAETRVSEARGHLEATQPVDAQLAIARANADLAHARRQSAESALEEAKLQLSYARIEAPADGVLSKLAVREGQLLQPGQQLVAVVPSATYVIANYKETQVGDMKKGQRVHVKVDAYPGRTFEGLVESTSPGTGARFSLLPPDNASGNFVKVVQRVPVKISWISLPTDVHLAAGMSCDVTVDTR